MFSRKGLPSYAGGKEMESEFTNRCTFCYIPYYITIGFYATHWLFTTITVIEISVRGPDFADTPEMTKRSREVINVAY